MAVNSKPQPQQTQTRRELTPQEQHRLDSGREYRSMTQPLEARAEDPDTMQVVGYATTFDQEYTLYDFGDYRMVEKVDPHAFDDCDMSDVIMQYDHSGRVFARNKNGTLKLTTDAHGLRVVADLGGTDIGRQLYQEIKGGYTSKMSFGFVVAEDERKIIDDRENNRTTVVRTITKISKLYDVSAVSIPANDMTEISTQRCVDGAIQQVNAERRAAAQHKLKIKIMLNMKGAN